MILLVDNIIINYFKNNILGLKGSANNIAYYSFIKHGQGIFRFITKMLCVAKEKLQNQIYANNLTWVYVGSDAVFDIIILIMLDLLESIWF